MFLITLNILDRWEVSLEAHDEREIEAPLSLFDPLGGGVDSTKS